MKLKRTATKATLMGAMSIAAAGFGAGLAHADPPFPTPPPWPVPSSVDEPGANVAAPGNPAPPDAISRLRREIADRCRRTRLCPCGLRRHHRRRSGRRGCRSSGIRNSTRGVSGGTVASRR